MSHKNENLASKEQVLSDAFPLWCTQIHTCFQHRHLCEALQAGDLTLEMTLAETCLAEFLVRFHHFNRWI